MTSQRRSLKSYFEAARSEQSPISAEATRTILANDAATATARSPFMSPALLATTAAALIATAGVTVKVIHDNDKKPQSGLATTTSISAPPSTPPPAMSQPGSSTPEPIQATTASMEDGGDDGIDTTRRMRFVIRDVSVTDDSAVEVHHFISSNSDLAVFALRADDDIYRSLGLERKAVQSICKSLAGADSVTDCSFEHPEPQMKVCMFTDGSTDEVVFMDRPGPMPVMFTSSDGRGKVVGSTYKPGVDPNKLVPVAAEGCGSNMLMWFEPTEEFVFSMPDSLGEELEQVIDMEVRVETVDGKTTVIQTHRTPDGKVTEEITEIEPTEHDPELFTKNNKLLRWTMDSTMKSINIDSILSVTRKNMKLGSDSLSRSFKILTKRQHITVDSLLQNLDVDMRELDVDLRELDIDIRDLDVDMHELQDGMQQLKESMKEMKHQFRFKFKNDSGSVHQFRFQSAPNIHRRVIILTSNVRVKDTPSNDDTVPPPPAPVMLQESRFGEGAVLSTKVYPNPTSDGGATVQFNLAEPRTVSLDLLSLSGETVMSLAGQAQRTEGVGQLAFPLEGVAPGMYLVSLTTDKGERAVQRLIVQ